MKPESLYLREDVITSTKHPIKVVSTANVVWKETGLTFANLTLNFENIIDYFSDCTQPTQQELDYFELNHGVDARKAFDAWLDKHDTQLNYSVPI
jgi:hypothetical protein